MHLISVIMVSFHTGPSLFDAIAALQRQTSPLEIIIVDNGNPPEDLDKIRERADEDSRIKLLTGHGNIGFGRANNLGVKASAGEYVLLLNPDCVVRADTLARLRHYTALPAPFTIGARILSEDGSDQRGCRRELLTPISALVEALHLGWLFPKYRLNRHMDSVPSVLTPIPAISGAFMFMPRASFDLISGFDENYFLHVEDLDFCYRFRKIGGEIYFAPDVIATHIGGTSAASSNFVESHKRRGFIRYFHTHFRDKTPLPLLWTLDIAIWMRYLLHRFLN